MTGFHHIALKTADFDQTAAFYTEGLGFKKSLFWGEGDNRVLLVDVGGGNFIEIFAGGIPSDPSGALLHFAFRSENCEADLARALAAGAEQMVAPCDVDIPSDPVKPVRIAFCKGLNGELIEFYQER
jgi:glyoxylase I family protein